jgi:signal transduction histidine kinase
LPVGKGTALPGSGLGLAIVRRVADIHDGTVEAIPLQQGMTFRISTPEIADPPLQERPPARS